MSKRLIQAIFVLAAGFLYWQVVCLTAGVSEPWDVDAYWVLWYPLSLALSGLAGWTSRGRGWAAGVLITFAQHPIMVISNGVSSLWELGLLMLSALAVPAVAAAALGDRLAQRSRAKVAARRV